MAEQIWKELPDFTIIPGTVGCSAKHYNEPCLWFYRDRFCVPSKGKGNRLEDIILEILPKYFRNITGKATVRYNSSDFAWDKFKDFIEEVKDICKKDNGMEL